MIIYRKLWDLLDKRQIAKSRLVADKVVIGQSYTNLVNGQSLTLKTLDRLCNYLNCQPGDILEYVPDNPDDTI